MESFKVENLSFTYPARYDKALDDINFAVNQGEFVLLCGKSGCGKTTLLRLLKSTLAPHGEISGNICFNGKALSDYNTKEQASGIGFVMQNPDNQIVTDKVWHELAFGLESLGYKQTEIRTRVSEMASFFGIQNWFYKKVCELSGGQKQLLNLASVMVTQPSVLILDEPTSQLDPIAAGEFLKTLEKINRELGTTVILTEHRLEDAFPMADRVIVMDGGKIIADETPIEVGKILKEKNHDMYKALPTPMRVHNEVENTLTCPLTVRDGRVWLSEYSKENTLNTEIVPKDKVQNSADTVIEIKDAWFRYEKELPEVDELTYKVAINGEEATTADTNYSFIPDKAGEYTLTFTANDGTADSEPYIVILTVTAGLPIPESITIEHNAKDVLTDGVIVFQKGDKFTLTAYDQDGNETPVTWKKTSSWDTTFVVDEATGEVEVTQDVYSGTSYIYFKAISTLDETVSGEITIKATGIAMSEYNKSQTVALSADGQTAKTASITGGIKGYNIWNYNIPEGVAELAEDPETGNSIKFNVYRPGTISATFKLNINEELTGTATITVTGVAVEDEVGNNGKTYLGINTNNPNPTKQLKAYVSESRSVASWSSADESIAAVDENGLVTAKGVGSVIITAADSEGTTGGIKVVVQ